VRIETPGTVIPPGQQVAGQQVAYMPQAIPAAYHPHLAKAHGFGQIFGIHPSIAFLTVVVDLMLFGGEVATAGVLLPIAVGVGGVLGWITYLTQRKWYGDDKSSAMIKALTIGLLTAIPAPLPALLSIPAGLVGLVHTMRKK
jgi:hypothetical protein